MQVRAIAHAQAPGVHVVRQAGVAADTSAPPCKCCSDARVQDSVGRMSAVLRPTPLHGASWCASRAQFLEQFHPYHTSSRAVHAT